MSAMLAVWGWLKRKPRMTAGGAKTPACTHLEIAHVSYRQ